MTSTLSTPESPVTTTAPAATATTAPATATSTHEHHTAPATTLQPPTPAEFRDVLRTVPTPLVAAASLIDGVPIGMVVGSFVGISLDPPIVSASLQATSGTWPVLRRADSLGITILTEEYADLVYQLAGPATQRFDNISWSTRGDAVVLDGAGAQLTAHIEEEITAGDHIIALLRVDHASHVDTTSNPLITHASRISTVTSSNGEGERG
ncbi:flavin reductase family protein [Corynebacterium sp.]|uniref:flavin reductase family protein n=1 Tax=Corynebacterium sp. TaxID=1720 RepID=UPI002F3E7A7A